MPKKKSRGGFQKFMDAKSAASQSGRSKKGADSDAAAEEKRVTKKFKKRKK